MIYTSLPEYDFAANNIPNAPAAPIAGAPLTFIVFIASIISSTVLPNNQIIIKTKYTSDYFKFFRK